ncbi:MAG: type II secretory ATPase GspE/PulE/Tfp pilus assembly ATPase PilB-like protein [Planctomycetota bacterium]
MFRRGFLSPTGIVLLTGPTGSGKTLTLYMSGEIRDSETASIAVQAALTGHLALSTLHNNDALSTVHRLGDMGIPPYLLGPALRCVVSQRLLPHICRSCAEPTTPSDNLLKEFGIDPAD